MGPRVLGRELPVLAVRERPSQAILSAENAELAGGVRLPAPEGCPGDFPGLPWPAAWAGSEWLGRRRLAR